MSLYNEVITNLRGESLTSELYRFQGGNSIEHFNIHTSRFNESSKDGYVYFSGCMDHHLFFTVRRIKQLLNKLVLEDEGLQLSARELNNPDSYKRIKNLVIHTDKLVDLYSVKLVTDKNLSTLIKDNCVYPGEKRKEKMIKRVDRRVYGGGYGLAAEWKELLTYMTFFSAYKRIDRNAILELIQNMRKTSRINRKENISFLLSKSFGYNFELNPSLESDFTKYKIMDLLERIIENELYQQESELGKNPILTTKRIVEDYGKKREKILTLFDEHIKKR